MAKITVKEALQRNDEDDWWRVFQVDYPEKTVGDWRIEKFKIDENDPARIMYMIEGGADRDCGYGTFTRIKHGDELWMADTRAEIVEQVELFNKLWWTETIPDKTVLINGLGLGISVLAAARAKNVTHVDVVECSAEVIDLVGEFMPDNVTIHHADAFEQMTKWPRGKRWTLAWHDIWQNISDDNLPEMARLHRSYGRRVDWQASWARDHCRRMRRDVPKFQAALKAGDWQTVKKIDPWF